MSERDLVDAIRGRAHFWPEGDMKDDLFAALAEVGRLRADLADAQRERDALAAEIDRTRHEYVTKDGIRNCAHVLRQNPGQFPYYCCQTAGAVKHKTSASIRAAVSAGGAGPAEGDKR